MADMPMIFTDALFARLFLLTTRSSIFMTISWKPFSKGSEYPGLSEYTTGIFFFDVLSRFEPMSDAPGALIRPISSGSDDSAISKILPSFSSVPRIRSLPLRYVHGTLGWQKKNSFMNRYGL